MQAYVDYLPPIVEEEEGGSCVVRSQRRVKKNPVALVVVVLCIGLSGLVFYQGKVQASEPSTMYLKKEDDECSSSYSKETLKTAADLSFAAAFEDTKGEKKWEASDVTIIDGDYYVVHDNSWALSKIDSHFLINSPKNIQYGNPTLGPQALRDRDGDSSYEAIVEITADTFYVVRESIDISRHNEKDVDFRALILKLRLPDADVLEECPSAMVFEGDSKGFEGAAGVTGNDGIFYLFGLCEGNHCAQGDKGKERGHGRIIVMAYEETTENIYGCRWKTVTTLEIPSTAHFTDYSSLTIQNDRIAISSQEDSKLWVGKIALDDNGLIQTPITSSNFFANHGHVLQFPRDDSCHIIYCNIEGIHWVNDQMLIAVSDKMKSKGKQHFRCLQKDQSIHLFVIP